MDVAAAAPGPRAKLLPTAGEISARIDRLPATRTVWRAILLLSAGMFFELYDLLFSAYVAPSLVKSGVLTQSGPGGLSAQKGAEWHHGFLYAQALTIGGGTSEVQRNILGESILGLPKVPN